VNLREEYMVNRRLLQQRYRRLQKRGYTPRVKIPKIPKTITPASIRRIVKLISKTPTVRELNKKLGLTATGKIKKSTKKKIKKKAKEILTGKKPTKKKTPTKKKDKYLPSEKDRILDNVSSVVYSIDDVDSLISNMYLSSKRGNNTHRANVYDLSRILRSKLDKAIFEDGEAVVAQRLKDNSELIEEAMQTVEGYYSESNEEQLKEAIDKIEELISIISGEDLTQDEAQSLEDIFSDSMSFYELDDAVVEKGNLLAKPMRNIKDKSTGETLDYIIHDTRIILDPETGEVLDTFII
jgi:hypothetical protein